MNNIFKIIMNFIENWLNFINEKFITWIKLDEIINILNLLVARIYTSYKRL